MTHDVVDRLVADPMYQLSTAGQELFHTNMLYWLAVNRPAESAPVWDVLGADAPIPAGGGRATIRREWQHIDLYVGNGATGRTLVLENKVLAIPRKSQLTQYRDTLRSLPGVVDEATSWVLLSLILPGFELPKPWAYRNYAELIPALDATARQLSTTEASLVRGYAALVSALVDLAHEFDPARRMNGQMFLAPADVSRLQGGRLLSLVRKLQYGRIALEIEALIPDSHGADIAPVHVGLTNTDGFVEWFLPGPKGRAFGWQAQGVAFRLAGLTSPHDPKPRPAREQVMETDHLDFFDFTLPSHLDGLLIPYAGKKRWLGYEPNFVYRYQRIAPHTSWRQFAEIAAWFTDRTRSYVELLSS